MLCAALCLSSFSSCVCASAEINHWNCCISRTRLKTGQKTVHSGIEAPVLVLYSLHMASKADSQEQKKRTSEALERRLALSKAEVQHKEQREKKRKIGLDRFTDNDKGSSSPAGVTAFRMPVTTRPSETFVKKETEVDDPIYLPISQSINENLVATSEVGSNGKPKVDKVLHELRLRGDSAQKYLQGTKSKKIDNWILLDDCAPTKNSSALTLRASNYCSKRSKSRMSTKQLKKHGSFTLPKKFQKYDIFLPMHEMWKGYVTRLLKKSMKEHLAQALLDVDLHGAILRVVECKTNALVGVIGIMIRETAETLGIFTQDNKFKVVPKKASVFLLQADCWKITLRGDKLVSRNPS